MYDISGLYYQMKVDSIVFVIVGILFLVDSHFWTLNKIKKKDLCVSLICCVISIYFLIYYHNVISDLKVSVHEGEFVEEHRESPYLFRMEYCFTTKNGLKPLFYLDVFSKKKIYPNDFEEGTRYRVYYEQKTNVIIKVEKLE